MKDRDLYSTVVEFDLLEADENPMDESRSGGGTRDSERIESV